MKNSLVLLNKALSELADLTDNAAEIGTPALIAELVAQYNAKNPNDAITPGVPWEGTRHISSQTAYSDQLYSALTNDPSGGAFLAMRLKALANDVKHAYLRFNELDAVKIENAVSDYVKVRTLVSQIKRASEYKAFLNAVEDIYQAAKVIRDRQGMSSTTEQLAESYPLLASEVNQAIKSCVALVLTESTSSVNADDVPLLDNLNEWVVKVGDDQTLLDVALQAPNGFTLFATLVPDDAAASYFSLLCKTPVRSILFQDVLKTKYPGQHTRRRNDRAHESRINRSPFPYSLFNLEITDNGRSIRENRDSSALTMTQGRSFNVLAHIRDIEEQELIQLLTAMRLIIADWSILSPPKLAQPQQALLSFKSDAIYLPMLAEKTPIHLPWEILTTHRLTTERYDALEQSAGHPPVPKNWVAEQLLPYVLEHVEEQPLCKAEGTELIISPSDGTPKVLNTEQGVKSDIVYLARCRQAKIIHAAIPKWKSNEVVRTREWLQTSMRDSPELFNHIVDMTRWGVDGGVYHSPKVYAGCSTIPDDGVDFYLSHEELLGFAPGVDRKNSDPREAMRKAVGRLGAYETTIWLNDKEHPQGFTLGENTVCLSSGLGFRNPKISHVPQHNITCALTDGVAEFFFELKLLGKFAVSQFSGVHWLELPPLLRILGDMPYLGNSILSRTDPLTDDSDWENRGGYVVRLGLSISALNSLRVNAGLDKLTKTTINRFIKERRASCKK